MVQPGLLISVIIPVYRGGQSFHHCLESVTIAMMKVPSELIVVADGDCDGSSLVAEEFEAQVINLSGPYGPAHARNVGAVAATGEILLFIDADVTVPDDCLSRVKAVFEQDPTLAAMIGSYDKSPADPGFLSQYRNLLHHYVHQTSSEQASTFWGACGAIRRSVFLVAGGFNEVYRFPSVEDIELGYRLKAAGYHLKLCKDIQVKHWKAWSRWPMIQTDLFRRAIPWSQLLLRNQTLINDLNLKISSRMSVICAWTVIVVAALSVFFSEQWYLSFATLLGLCLTFWLLNRDFYQFLVQARGYRFALRSLPWHWLYYIYSGLGLGVAVILHGYTLIRNPQHPKSELLIYPHLINPVDLIDYVDLKL